MANTCNALDHVVTACSGPAFTSFRALHPEGTPAETLLNLGDEGAPFYWTDLEGARAFYAGQGVPHKGAVPVMRSSTLQTLALRVSASDKYVPALDMPALEILFLQCNSLSPEEGDRVIIDALKSLSASVGGGIHPLTLLCYEGAVTETMANDLKGIMRTRNAHFPLLAHVVTHGFAAHCTKLPGTNAWGLTLVRPERPTLEHALRLLTRPHPSRGELALRDLHLHGVPATLAGLAAHACGAH